MKNPKVFVTSIALPVEWVKELRRIAHTRSLEEEREISYSDLIRKAVKKEYGFKLPEGVKK